MKMVRGGQAKEKKEQVIIRLICPHRAQPDISHSLPLPVLLRFLYMGDQTFDPPGLLRSNR